MLCQAFGQWSVEGEVLRTGLRLVSVAIYSYLYRQYFNRQPFTTEEIQKPQFAAALILLFVFAACYTNAKNETALWQTVFAVSGIAAGFREELFYRGIVQNTLQQSYNHKIALLLATLVFVLSHVQYLLTGQFYGLLFITLAGVIFGSLFSMTGSILFSGCVHGLYDALLSIDSVPFRLNNGSALLALAALALFFIVINKKLFASQTSDTTSAISS